MITNKMFDNIRRVDRSSGAVMTIIMMQNCSNWRLLYNNITAHAVAITLS